MIENNCWEFKKCGREPGGLKTHEFGTCPASLPNRFDGINKGDHGGRFCWVIAGTFCNGTVQGTYAKKLIDCLKCDFLKSVQNDEDRSFILIPNQISN